MKKYSVNQYIELLNKNNLLITTIHCNHILNEKIEHVSYNSKDILPRTLFICKGANFKEEYLQSAIKNGAMVYVSEVEYSVNIPCILVSDIKISLSVIAAYYFNYPADKLNVIGVTGTKGKSTTSYFIKYILDEYKKSTGLKDTGIISSIDTYDGKDTVKSLLTTPESYDLQELFYRSLQNGVENVVMEVSSQALKYGRVHDVEFDISVFLNISEDHIGPIEHPNFEDYFDSKLKIFAKSKIACINLDSDDSDVIYHRAKHDANQIVTFSTKNSKADVYGYHIRKEGLKTFFCVKTKSFEKEMVLSIPGLFNVENALAAIAVADYMKIPEKYIYLGLSIAKSEGRMEIYHSNDEKIVSIVDYAHNKVSFEKIFDTTKREYPDRKIIAIFGCPGNKAEIRRKDLGEEAGKSANKIYLTEDDPAYESVEQISNEVIQYLKKYNDNYTVIEDRSAAIKEAVKFVADSKEKYIILILGKGNERTQKVAGGLVPYKSDMVNILESIHDYENSHTISNSNH
ncbi:MAG: UDP-N-acetylmuramoyl-L-alanyl-D-glutamate--2,6-diaminopimelate ligase [Clostridia bacterium]|nr:UDP-N-acetylmuramoyl-L-alanyl-D-glutamate--2,6-diaminopimelate ligase [Clostridia bacterium]